MNRSCRIVRKLDSSASASESAVGLASGLIASLAAGRLLRSFLYGVKPLDAATYIAAAAALLALSITAALLPARCASRIDPMIALRSE
jgi:ABC-type antimicrobial peptide transport system permease subunit